MPIPYLGIDPGKTGAALLLSEARQPLVLYAWHPRTQFGATVYEVAIVSEAGQRRETVANLHAVGLLMEASVARVLSRPCWGVAAEAPYVGRNAGTGLIVAYQTGLLAGPLEGHMAGKVLQVRASIWRRELLGLPPATKREKAKRYSLDIMPRRLPGLEVLLQRASQLLGIDPEDMDHATDAGGVAEYGYIHSGDATKETPDASTEDLDKPTPAASPRRQRRKGR